MTHQTPRAVHLQWCKDRANEYLNRGNVIAGVTSMLSDLDKHPDTALPTGSPLAMLGLMACLGTVSDARRFVEGFN